MKATTVKAFRSSTFDFPDLLTFLEKTGKKIYGEKFQIHDEDHLLIFKLLVYFFRDEEHCSKLEIDLNKGILLSGPIGCGKTSLMNLMKYQRPAKERHRMISTRKIAFQFNKDGYDVIEKYSARSFNFQADPWVPITYCFDDLGVENNIKYYGNECNVMAEILLSRYDLFITNAMQTHATTNLNSSELETLYGNRVRSRMRQMFNLMGFDSKAKDKRI
ncbi:MAG: ATPase [Bacteroidota bacterium]